MSPPIHLHRAQASDAKSVFLRRFGITAGVQGFTLVELLLSMTILSVLMLVVVNVIGVIQKEWVRAQSRVSAFREARMALDVIGRNLSQATLNTYWATQQSESYTDNIGQIIYLSTNYERTSELQFVCGRSTTIIPGAAGQVNTYPGHAVFFQATLGTARLQAASGTAADTENMVNLLCGRGYFVSWGDDAAFKPPFLVGLSSVQPRFRYRLMEYSPTAEHNRIYYDPKNTAIKDRLPITNPGRSRMWYDDALSSSATAQETAGDRGFTRPVADNILTLVLSPQLEQTKGVGAIAPESIAPNYLYDSVMVTNPGATAPSPLHPQGTRHLLPPLIKLTLVALDNASGEKLAEKGNGAQQQRVAGAMASLFVTATGYNDSDSAYHRDLTTLQNVLIQEKLNFRVFTTTIVMKQARWSH